MVNELLQSVAFRCVFKAYLAGTNTAATGKTIAVTLSKNGSSFANPSGGATNATEIANGWYYVDGSTTDAGTLGDLVVRGTEGTIDPAERLFRVVKATNRGMTGVPDAAANANGGLPILSSSGTTLAYTLSTLTTYTGNTPQTGDSFALIGTNGSGLTALGDTRLGNLDAAVSSRLASSSYAAPLDAAGVRTAVGLAAANLDTQLAAIASYIDTEVATLVTSIGSGLGTLVSAVKAKTDNLPADPAGLAGLASAHGAGSWATATSVTVSDKTGFKLASDGLSLVVPADPSSIPVLGTSSIVAWIGYFGAWTLNEVDSTSSTVKLRNSADNADLVTHAVSDDGTTFTSGEAT